MLRPGREERRGADGRCVRGARGQAAGAGAAQAGLLESRVASEDCTASLVSSEIGNIFLQKISPDHREGLEQCFKIRLW